MRWMFDTYPLPNVMDAMSAPFNFIHGIIIAILGSMLTSFVLHLGWGTYTPTPMVQIWAHSFTSTVRNLTSHSP